MFKSLLTKLPNVVRLLLAILISMPVWGSYAKAQTVEPYAVFDVATGTLTFKCDDGRPSEAYSLNTDNASLLWISYHKETIKKVVFDASFAKARPTTCCNWFRNCENLREIEGIENLNTENVTDMAGMFSGCSRLTSLNVSNFNTENVTDMSNMFCLCSGLTSLDVSNFNTENVTNMSKMFEDCSGLTSLDVSNFNTENVTDMSNMFEDCKILTSLDVSNFNTKNVTSMFYMFDDCSGLTSLDVSNFNTENVTDMSYMFDGCFNLKTIYASDKFVATDDNGDNMFSYCLALKGAIAYDENKTDSRYANTTDGYFTLKNASGINALTTPNNETTEYFNLQGVRANNKHKGINIVRRGNKTMKVLVK